MEVLTSRWSLAIIFVLFVIAMLYLVGKKSVHTELLIPATPNQVWSVLIDTPSYNQWNSILLPVEGTLEEGAEVKYRFHQDAESSYEIPSRVKKMEVGRLLNQTGGTAGILTFDHRYILQPDGDATRVIIHEEYSGIAVPFWNPGPVEKAYKKLINELKNRVTEVHPS